MCNRVFVTVTTLLNRIIFNRNVAAQLKVNLDELRFGCPRYENGVKWNSTKPVADPGFPVGGSTCRGRRLPRRLRFENFVCQNERIWTLSGRRGVHWAYPVDPPMQLYV